MEVAPQKGHLCFFLIWLGLDEVMSVEPRDVTDAVRERGRDTGTCLCPCLAFGWAGTLLPASRTSGKKCLLLKLPRLWSFVRAALCDETKSLQFFIEHHVSSGLYVYGLYHVEAVPFHCYFAECFYHERVYWVLSDAFSASIEMTTCFYFLSFC